MNQSPDSDSVERHSLPARVGRALLRLLVGAAAGALVMLGASKLLALIAGGCTLACDPGFSSAMGAAVGAWAFWDVGRS